VRNGHLPVNGWSLSQAGIEDIQVLVDGHLCASLSYGAERPDVAAANPQFRDSVHCGFIGRVRVDSLAAGEHSLVLQILSRDGGRMELTRRFRVAPKAGSDPAGLDAEYLEWLAWRSPSKPDLEWMRAEGERLPYQPIISLVVPVDNTPEDWLRMMADSVMAQTYGRWELCLAEGTSTAPHVRPFLDRLAERDPRVKVSRLNENPGTAGRSNAALALATGEFIGLLDPGDVLTPSALFEVVRALSAAPDTDLIYSDEDRVDETGEGRWDPFFKPDWSPDLLLSANYVGHFSLYRRALVQAIGGFRPAFEGSQDYDLVLRFTERTDRIVHLPSVLYSRRMIPGFSGGRKMAERHAVESARRAVADALRRRGVAGHVEPGCRPGRWRVRYELRGRPAVTLVIPSGGKMNFLQACLESVLERSTYSNLHLLVIDNSDGTAVADLCHDLRRRDSRVMYQRHRIHPFNYSVQNNFALTLVDTPYVVLLNDDVTVITPDWVESMLEHAQRPEVGVVGAKLLFPDRTLQHAGVILGPYETCSHAFRFFPEDDPGHHDLPHLIRNCSAVTFACAMMRHSVYDEVGGLDEQNLAVAYNDVDMCLRIRERGYRVVYTPHAVLCHHESVTKDVSFNPGEVDYLRRRWGALVRHDPFYNPNLTRKTDDYSLNFDLPTIPGSYELVSRPDKFFLRQ
jgi:GT2 family glycosyltransferase